MLTPGIFLIFEKETPLNLEFIHWTRLVGHQVSESCSPPFWGSGIRGLYHDAWICVCVSYGFSGPQACALSFFLTEPQPGGTNS